MVLILNYFQKKMEKRNAITLKSENKLDKKGYILKENKAHSSNFVKVKRLSYKIIENEELPKDKILKVNKSYKNQIITTILDKPSKKVSEINIIIEFLLNFQIFLHGFYM